MPSSNRAKRTLGVQRYTAIDGQFKRSRDWLASEEPLEIRLGEQTLALTMRTPDGHDFELVMGFLYNEGVIGQARDVVNMRYCADDQEYNVVQLTLAQTPETLPHLNRHFYSNSACGVCGSTSLHNLAESCSKIDSSLQVSHEVILSLPHSLGQHQQLFERTGGLHACALFDARGKLQVLREDIGRHNAFDKLTGYVLMHNVMVSDSMVLLSGRSSYELLQKSVRLGIPIVCSISAPSSLAYQLAQQFGITLIGFLRATSFNVYCNQNRIIFI